MPDTKPSKKPHSTPQGRKAIKGTIPDQLHRALRLRAFQDGVLMFDVVEAALSQYLTIDTVIPSTSPSVTVVTSDAPNSNTLSPSSPTVPNVTTQGNSSPTVPNSNVLPPSSPIVQEGTEIHPTGLVARIEQAGEEFERDLKAKEPRLIPNDLTSMAEDRRIAAEADGTWDFPAPKLPERAPDVIVPMPLNYEDRPDPSADSVLENEVPERPREDPGSDEEDSDAKFFEDLDLDD